MVYNIERREADDPEFANGRYEIRRPLGEGSRKRVYLAHDTRLDRDVAAAVIKTEGLDAAGLARAGSDRSASAVARRRQRPRPGLLELAPEPEQGTSAALGTSGVFSRWLH